MKDPRLTLARDRVAAASLRGQVEAERYVELTPRVCRADSAPVRGEPHGRAEQVNQLLFGESFEVLDEAGGWCLGQGVRDGYVGYVAAAALATDDGAPTHRVAALRAYAFPEPDLRSTPPRLLSMNALVRVTEQHGRYMHAEHAGWIPDIHLAAADDFETDFVAVAERFAGAPYLWGGRESLGLDCSGLLQQALFACGRPCPRDADLQEAMGAPAPPDALCRGDLVFWTNHVAIVLGVARILHANAHHMAVAIEPLEAAIRRIEAAGFGAPTSYRRLQG